MQRASAGAKWETPYGYCAAVRAGNQVFVKGTVGEGDTPEKQAKDGFLKIEQALKTVGASLDDVVRTRMFVTNIERDSDTFGRIHGTFFQNRPPACSMIQVAALIEPRYVIEIEVDAVILSSKM